MHSYVAFLMYPEIRRCSIEDLTPDKLKYIKEEYPQNRRFAKNAGFAVNYGGNGSTIAKNCNIPKSDGDFVYDSYFNAFPGLREYFNLVYNKAEYFGYVQFNNITRRKYIFSYDTPLFKYKEEIKSPYFWQMNPNAKEINKEYNTSKNEVSRIAQNFPIQGSAADITKYACILFFKEILQRNWFMIVKIVNLVHDEIVIEYPINLGEEPKEVLLSCMRKAGDPFCPIIKLDASADTGDHWIH